MFRAKQKMTPRKASRGLRKVSAARRLHHTGRSLVAKRYWRIRGYKKFDQFFDETIPFGSLTEDQLKQLLKCLAAKGGLSYAEIIGVYVKRKTIFKYRKTDLIMSIRVGTIQALLLLSLMTKESGGLHG